MNTGAPELWVAFVCGVPMSLAEERHEQHVRDEKTNVAAPCIGAYATAAMARVAIEQMWRDRDYFIHRTAENGPIWECAVSPALGLARHTLTDGTNLIYGWVDRVELERRQK